MFPLSGRMMRWLLVLATGTSLFGGITIGCNQNLEAVNTVLLSVLTGTTLFLARNI